MPLMASSNTRIAAMEQLIQYNYYKIISINLNDESFEICPMGDAKDKISVNDAVSNKISECFVNFADGPLCHPDDRQRFLSITDIDYLRSHFARETDPVRIRFSRKFSEEDLEWSGVHLEIHPGERADDTQTVYLYEGLLTSLDANKALEIDELTGLYNKQAFYCYAEELLKAEADVAYDLIIADIDNFKMVNNIYGPNMGDDVLAYLGRAVKGSGDRGMVGRYGGDMFVAIIPDDRGLTTDMLSQMAGEVLKNAPVKDLTLKFGLYKNIDHNLAVSLLCDRALIALRSIKHVHGENAAEYDEEMSRKLYREHEIELSFAYALENEEFEVWFQPKYDSDSETICGAEALVRWRTSDGRIVPPGEFVPLFEKDGQVCELDEYVFRKVCEQQKRWLDKGHKLIPISVNLSRVSMYHPDVVSRYEDIVRSCGIPFESVPIEITESAALESKKVQKFADAFSDAGFSLQMDDFGAGYSSLHSLNVMNFDVIKIDKSLTDDIGNGNGDKLLTHTIALTRELGMKVVAEGVETKDQLQFLRKQGCDAIQGYYFSKPLSLREFERVLYPKK